MGLPAPIKRFTVGEYYRLERDAAYKSDYYQSEIFAMAGGTIRHSLISGNIGREVGNGLKGKPCTTFESNLRLKIKATGLRTYPDVSVYCDPFERDEEDPSGETLTNPAVLFEVLSPSTEAYDRGLKSEHYRRIESLRVYILVSQDVPHAEVYDRQADGSWRLRDYRGLEAVLPLTPIGVDLPLAEVYARVEFAPPSPAGSGGQG